MIQLTFKAPEQGRGAERGLQRAACVALLTASTFLGGLVSTASAQEPPQPRQSPPAAKKAVPGVHYKPHSKKVESTVGGYTIEMPSQPIAHEDDLGGGMSEKMLLQGSTNRCYGVSHIDLKGSAAKVKNARAALKGFVKGSRQGIAIENEKEISLGRRSVPGLEYECEATKGMYVREHVYADGTRLHRIWIGSKDRSFLRSAEAERYFKSFALIEARPKAEHPNDWMGF
jgi:hypothetical protein